MQAIFSITIPFFALVLCGYLAAQRRVLPESAIAGLNAFVLFFALPCMLFRFGASTPVLQLLNPVVLTVYLLAALMMVSFTVAMTLSRRVQLKDAAFGALVAAFPNTGFMGVPLLVALLGPAAAGPVICTILADMMVTSSVCLGLAQSQGSGRSGGRQAAWRALQGALSNPLPWSIALGALVGALGLSLPGPADTVVRMLADAASPVALFTIGAVLWRAGEHARRQTTFPGASAAAPGPSTGPFLSASRSAATSSASMPSNWPHSDEGGVAPTSPDALARPLLRNAPVATTPVALYLPVALIKLLLHPLLVLLLGASARALGAPLSNFQLTVLTLAAALPSASSVSLLAERYGADNGRVARIILSSTVLAFGSFSLLAWLFGVQPG